MNNRLFWKISAILFLLILCLGVAFTLINVNTSKEYHMETNQKLYGNIAAHTVAEVKPLINGEVDTNAIQDIMHSMMVINPSVEVYLLDTKGEIITYVAPYKKVQLERVNLAPIRRFIDDKPEGCVLGDDPRFPGQANIFSAAQIEREGKLEGYVYVILASEEQADVSSTLMGSYILKSSFFAFLASIIAALLIGLVAVWFLTRNLNKIIGVVKEFKDGNYKARMNPAEQGDLKEVATTFNAMADQIAQNIENLQSVETLRRELVANVSHDLRTPLSIMRGYVETLQLKGSQLSREEKTKYLTIIAGSTEKLDRLIKQLFEYSKLEANEIKPIKEPFSLSELAQDSMMKYHMKLEERKITLSTNFEDHAPMVFGDVSLIERVIQNLMDNAIKFTPVGGHIKLQINSSGEHVGFSITDSGPGIPEHEQKEIFERFKQAKTTVQKQEGTGLGLAIAKKIVNLHNSQIEVRNMPDMGASFNFSLPQYLMGKVGSKMELA